MPTVHKDEIRFEGNLRFPTTVGNVHDSAPTIAQLTAEFAAVMAATTVPAEVRIVNDAAGGTNVYLAVKVGSDYFFTKLTKAS